MNNKVKYFFFCIFFSSIIHGQELNATVVLNTAQLGTSIDQSLFSTLQKQIADFLNTRKWTSDNYQTNEKINCNFTLILTLVNAQNIYSAQLIIQAARPVYNSSYQSALVNYQDRQITFKYLAGQQLNFNPTQISGADPLISNFTAILAFYANIIIGMNYDSFKLNAGKPYFSNAMNIVSAAPQNSLIKGWSTFDGQRSRYWLATNLNDSKLDGIHEVFYEYYHQGLDSLYDADTKARQNVLDALNNLATINQNSPNTMIEQFFVENRYSEFIGIFKPLPPDVRSQALQTLIQIDPQSTDRYNTELK